MSTEYLFRRDQDGDYWLVDNRGVVIRTERGAVYATPINDAVGSIDAVDLSVTYAVETGGQQVAVTALALRPGGSVAAGDLSEALSDLPVGTSAGHRARGAGHDAQRVLSAPAEPVARRRHSEGLA